MKKVMILILGVMVMGSFCGCGQSEQNENKTLEQLQKKTDEAIKDIQKEADKAVKDLDKAVKNLEK